MRTLLSTKNAATVLGVSVAFLERDRWNGPLIPFIRVGTRSVRYDPADLDAYIKDQRELPEEEDDLDDDDYDGDEGDDDDLYDGADDDYYDDAA